MRLGQVVNQVAAKFQSIKRDASHADSKGAGAQVLERGVCYPVGPTPLNKFKL